MQNQLHQIHSNHPQACEENVSYVYCCGSVNPVQLPRLVGITWIVVCSPTHMP